MELVEHVVHVVHDVRFLVVSPVMLVATVMLKPASLVDLLRGSPLRVNFASSWFLWTQSASNKPAGEKFISGRKNTQMEIY